MPKLVLPEYGRTIHNMLDVCLSIDDRAERTRCARSIIDAMSIIFPPQGGDQQAYRRKLWDHLMVMSDFRLDVDLPFELIHSEALTGVPETVSRPMHTLRRRGYGHLVESAIAAICEMPQGDERLALSLRVADHMKKILSASNPDGVDDIRVFKDMYEMSDGAIHLDPADVALPEYKIIAAPTGKKKRKK